MAMAALGAGTAGAAGATTTAATTATAAALALRAMFAATVAVGGMTLTMALGGIGALRTTLGTALGAGTAGATATTATTTTAVASIAFATGGGLRAGETAGSTGGGGFAGLGSHRAEETFDPTEDAGGLFPGLVRGNRSAGGIGVRDRSFGLRTAIIAGLAGAAVALLRTVAAATTAAATTAIATAGALTTEVATRGVATGVGSAFQHGNIAATLGAEHRTFGTQRRLGAGRGGRGCGSGGFIALVGEGGRFPALGRMLHLGRREDVELGLGGGSSGLNNSRDGRDWSGGRGLRGFGSNNRNNRGRRLDHGGGSGGGFVRRSERVLVFRLRRQNLHGGGFVGAGDGVAAGRGRGGLGTDAFAARETGTAVGT
jgi:hypothetical protein